MKISKKILPGQAGSKALLKIYGDKLLCVRYRYDYAKRKKFKTVELIVSEHDWMPDKHKTPTNKLVFVRINFNEVELRQKVKIAGGFWNKKKRLWQLNYGKILELGLYNRIVNSIE